MQSGILSSGAVLGIAILMLTLFSKTESNPIPNQEDLMNAVVDDEGGIRVRNPYLFELLANLEQDLMARKELLENTKRGLDLGLSRGFSGSQAAKHLMGLAAANFAGGPGRKRRSLTHLS